MSLTRVNYYVKKISTGYLIEYYLDGFEHVHAFDTWKETLEFLKDNPPKVMEQVKTKDYFEVEELI